MCDSMCDVCVAMILCYCNSVLMTNVDSLYSLEKPSKEIPFL